MPQNEAPQENSESSFGSSLSEENLVARDIRLRYLNENQSPDSEEDPPQQSWSNDSLNIENEFQDDDPYSQRAYLFPVVLPNLTEPTLDELLRRVTGRDDLHNTETVKLRVISSMISLSRLPLFLPNLKHLDLSGSVLNSIRDLGCGLIHLTHLNVSSCGLTSCDGTNGIQSIEVLIADNNMIQLVDPISNLSFLKKLSLRNNHISNLNVLSFLGMCTKLIEVDLQDNIVAGTPNYRAIMKRNIPSLEILDSIPFTEGGGEDSNITSMDSSEYSLLSDNSNMESISSAEVQPTLLTQRPQSNISQRIVSPISLNQRPSSSPPIISLRGNPIFGSVLKIVRTHKHKKSLVRETLSVPILPRRNISEDALQKKNSPGESNSLP